MNNWEQAWLAYEPLEHKEDSCFFKTVYTRESGPHIEAALEEIAAAAQKLFSVVTERTEERDEAGIVLERADGLKLGEEGYTLTEDNGRLTVRAGHTKGLLYGAFRAVLLAAAGEPLKGISLTEKPENPIRMINHWDNMDGSIERGYSGRSFLFEDGEICLTERIRDYARLLCSVGINGISINNVNVRNEAKYLITDRYYSKLAVMARMFERYGIAMYLCVDFAAPVTLGQLPVSDPLEAEVEAWWNGKCREIFEAVPELKGFLVKADSEGQPGPYAYGRNHADGANMLARAVKPYGGTIIWRCFVYNCEQDWRDRKTDRACAGYDNFMPLDGSFAENVILQIKNGPMDFQIREPVHPLFGGMQHTNQMLELQIAQEYTGQQIDVCYLVPLWKEVLEFATGCGKEADTVADIVAGRTFGQTRGGMAAVSNTGGDSNWTGHDLAGANLFGFGRLAWNPGRTAGEIAGEWTALQISRDGGVIDIVKEILLRSREIYEKYTVPLGIGFMVNPAYHYGPNPEGYEYSRWGTYHRADHLAIGVERGAEGTGYSEQYFEKNAALYRNIETCPEELLLFFHRIPYTHRLSSGKTLIQHVYDSHFKGYEEMVELQRMWLTLEGRISARVFERVSERFVLQEKNCREWRDVINSFFYRKSMIPDEKGRAIY